MIRTVPNDISRPEISDIPQYMVGATVEVYLIKNTSLTHPNIDWKVVRNGTTTTHSTMYQNTGLILD